MKCTRPVPIALYTLCSVFPLTTGLSKPLTDASVPHSLSTPVDLIFSDLCRIDESRLEPHDPKHLFYFNLYAPGAPGMPEQVFPLHAEGDTHFKVWLDPKVPVQQNPDRAARSLAVQITSDTDAHKKDKIFLALVPDDAANHLTEDAKDNMRFVSFDFMLDPHYEKPTAWAMHFQAWQCCGGHPPFTMEVTPGADPKGPIDITFGLRDDIAENNPDHSRTLLSSIRLKRGEWHNFAFALSPQSDNSKQQGMIAMWLDGKERFSFKGPWGYDPQQHTTRGHLVSDKIAIEFGVYRQRQRTTQTVYFQHLHFRSEKPSALSAGTPKSG